MERDSHLTAFYFNMWHSMELVAARKINGWPKGAKFGKKVAYN
jgi:hypothetical protein